MGGAANNAEIDVPSTMRAAVLRHLGDALTIEEVPVPTPGRGEVLIRVTACGVCHSDVHAIDGDWSPPPTLPLIPGHEIAGHVAAVGDGVTWLVVGDAVGVPWLYSACGTCEYCLAGMETICQVAEATGYSKSGGYAEYVIADAAFVVALPDGVDHIAVAPILCAGVTTYRDLKRSGARAGQWLAVVGIGGLGHLAVQYAVAMGLRVVAVDVGDDKLSLARSLGAEVTVNAAQVDAVAAVHEVVGGAHASIVTAVASVAFEQAVEMLRPGGTAIYIGLPGGEADTIRTSIASLTNFERTVRGSNVGTRVDLAEAVDFAARGAVAATVRAITLDQVGEVLDEMRAGRVVGRVVIAF